MVRPGPAFAAVPGAGGERRVASKQAGARKVPEDVIQDDIHVFEEEADAQTFAAAAG